MRRVLSTTLVCCLIAGASFAGDVGGLYQTEPSDSGGVLHVDFGACDSDATLTCATIAAAYDKDRVAIADYAHLGRPIVWDMQSEGGGHYGGGKIWDPYANKTYKSKMRLRSNVVRVSGCVGPICKSQNWIKVK